MADPTYPLFPIFSFLGFLLSIIPLPWHFQAWNSGTVYFMLWSALACLNVFINSIVWAGNAKNSAPIWCEISIRITLGASVAIPAASLCINRRLYKIATVQAVSSSPREKYKAIFVDTLICVAFPLVYVAMQYIVQGHRFDILEDIGCFPAVYNTILTYFISIMWPLVIGLISACYCVATLRSFNRRRLEFSSFLRSNQSSLTFSRYFRLMALAMTDILISSPLSIFMIWVNIKSTPIEPYISWADTHYNYGRIEQVPAIFWRNSGVAAVGIEFSRWVVPICGLLFFAFFGFADEAMRNYKKVWVFISRPFRAILPTSPLTDSKIDTKEKLRSFGRNYLQPRPTVLSQSSTSTLPMYSPSSTAIVSLSDIKRNDSLTTLKSPPSTHSPRKSKADSLFSSSVDPCSPTLSCYSLPDHDKAGRAV